LIEWVRQTQRAREGARGSGFIYKRRLMSHEPQEPLQGLGGPWWVLDRTFGQYHDTYPLVPSKNTQRQRLVTPPWRSVYCQGARLREQDLGKESCTASTGSVLTVVLVRTCQQHPIWVSGLQSTTRLTLVDQPSVLHSTKSTKPGPSRRFATVNKTSA
jgi:hypothetical protein